MKIDHVCIAVKSIDKASIRFCELFGYTPLTEIVENSLQEVRVQFLHKLGSLTIKLIEPAHNKSPLIRTLKKGEGLHHICFKTDNLESEVKNMQDKGLRILSKPQPGEAFDDELIAFFYAGFGLNIELIDTDKKRAKL